MSSGNQTLLLSGSLLSNAATELAQTLRVDLLQLLDQSVSNLNRYGLSDSCVNNLKRNGFLLVQDLNFLQVSHLRPMGFSSEDVPLVTQVCNEVRRTISVGSLSKILKNASQNITEIAANLPIKNTFIEFPNLFSQGTERQPPQSCPAFFLEEERKALAELEASIQQQVNNTTALIGRPPEPSRGADVHGRGSCKPCAWYHHAEGCRHGYDCEFCHMCPVGEIKKRKKEKQKIIRTLKTDLMISTPENDEQMISTDSMFLANGYSDSTTCNPLGSTTSARQGLSSWIGSIFAK
jgi:hypothetical protein